MKPITRLNIALQNGLSKEIFDHIRNYLMCAMILAIGTSEIREQSSLLFGLMPGKYSGVGVVAFAGQAFTQVPLTLDYGVVTTLLGELETGMIEDGTAVGMGLATAVKRLQASSADSKVVILLTDGVSNAGDIPPLQAAELAATHGIKVYAIGAGRTGDLADNTKDRHVFGRLSVDCQNLIVSVKTGPIGRCIR